MTSMEVRYKRPGTKMRWRYGRVRDAGVCDASCGRGWVTLIDQLTGGTVTLDAEHVQRMVVGPRGGKKWVPFAEDPEDDAEEVPG